MRRIEVRTRARRELVDVTRQVAAAARETGGDGAWLVYVPHTTAGVTINEGADPTVAEDVLMALEAMVPAGQPWKHAEGNSPAHVLSSIVGSSVLVAVEDGELQLGTWQAIFLCEFDGPRSRLIWLQKLE